MRRLFLIYCCLVIWWLVASGVGITPHPLVDPNDSWRAKY